MKTDITKFIIDRNIEQSKEFCNSGNRTARRMYRANHPTEIIALKCMDGRLNLSLMTETPVGIMDPYRTMGGRFNLGWRFFGNLIGESTNYANTVKGRDCLVLATYHFSKGDTHRGCKGFGFDTDAAREASSALVEQFKNVFNGVGVFAVLVGIETDDEALIFHDQKGNSFSVADNLFMDEQELDDAFEKLYPKLKKSVRADLLELVKGNQRHVAKVVAQQKEVVDLDHREQVIAVGRGFDWLHIPNKALIIGPYNDDWKNEVVVAGKIILDNFAQGRLSPDQGVLLLVSSLSRDDYGSPLWNLAIEKARDMTRVAMETLERELPELNRDHQVCVVTGVVDANTRLMHRIDESEL